MKLTKLELFKAVMQNFSNTAKVVEGKSFIKSGAYKYYKETNEIVKDINDTKYVGGRYEKIKRQIVFKVEKALGTIKIISTETNSVLINMSHRTEPLILV